MGGNRGRAFWERLVKEVERGETIQAVAIRHGVSVSGLGTWVRRLRAERPVTALLPVRVVDGGARRVVVEMEGIRVVFEDGAEPGYVALVARALRDGC